MENAITQRIKRIMENEKLTNSSFSSVTGIPRTTIANMFIKGTSPSFDFISRISDTFPAYSLDWLITGKGSMLKSEQITSIKERINHFLKEQNIEPRDFCESIGMSYPRFHEMKGSLPERYLKSITEKYPHLSASWLMTGEGSMLKHDETLSREYLIPDMEAMDIAEKRVQETKPRIPLTATAGSLSGISEGVTLRDCEQLPIIHQLPFYNFTMFIKGDSMSPRFESGDEIACRQIDQSRFIQWGKPHVLDTTQGIIIKRVYEDGDKIRCTSYNPNYSDFSIPKEDIYSMSLVVGLVSIMEM